MKPDTSSARPVRRNPIVAAATAAAIVLSAGSASAAGWLRPHADSANTGFVDVVTAPAGKASQVINGLGTFAPGVGPVVGADGTVYIGTEQGTFYAFHADGSPAWKQSVTGSIRASSAVGADGSVYVVVQKFGRVLAAGNAQVNDQVLLHKFSPAGAELWQVALPSHPVPNLSVSERSTAAPNIVASADGGETIIVPTVSSSKSGQDFRLAAISSGGQVLFDQRVSFTVDDILGGVDPEPPLWTRFDCTPDYGCWYPTGDDAPLPAHPADALPQKPIVPLPGVAVLTSAGRGLPWVLASDHVFDLVGFSFSPTAGFHEVFRRHRDEQLLVSPPTTLPDGRTLIGTLDGHIAFAGPGVKLPDLNVSGATYGTPTRLADGRVVVVGLRTDGGSFAVLKDGEVFRSGPLAGQSIAGAAASRTHFFISTASTLYSFDAATMKKVNEIFLPGGGLASPAIGPGGHVYALASNILFVFPPPVASARVLDTFPTAPKVVLQPQAAAVAPQQPASQTFQPPLTSDGKRLYACQDFKGNGCGAPVAAAFCRKQGFVQAVKLDTQSEKVQAETLDGRLCDKKKCRVFELIECTR